MSSIIQLTHKLNKGRQIEPQGIFLAMSKQRPSRGDSRQQRSKTVAMHFLQYKPYTYIGKRCYISTLKSLCNFYIANDKNVVVFEMINSKKPIKSSVVTLARLLHYIMV